MSKFFLDSRISRGMVEQASIYIGDGVEEKMGDTQEELKFARSF